MMLKPGVKAGGIRPEMIFVVLAAFKASLDFGFDLVITSITEGKHSRTSLHFSGAAIDIRINNMPAGVPDKVVKRLRASLTDEYDVLLERDHIHAEWQPKR